MYEEENKIKNISEGKKIYIPYDVPKHFKNPFTSITFTYFYKLFERRKMSFTSDQLRNYVINKKKVRNYYVSRTLYHKVLKKYFQIYFFKFMFENKPRYFFIGGQFYKTMHRGMLRFKKKVVTSIIFHWYDRMSLSYLLNVKMSKYHKGGINGIEKLIENFFEVGDIDAVKRREEFYKELFGNNRLFKL